MRSNCCHPCRPVCLCFCPCCCPGPYPPPEPLCQVTTGIATDITTTSALIQGNQFFTSPHAISVGVEVSTAPGFSTVATFPALIEDPFSVELNGLTPDTTYYYRAFTQTALSTCRGVARVFTTPATPPPHIVITGDPVNILYSSALIVTNQFSGIPIPIFSVGVEYSTDPALSDPSTILANIIETPYNVQLSGLASSTTYYYRATVNAENGIFVGEIKSFATSAAPAVYTGTATNVTQNTATIVTNSYTDIPGTILSVGVQYAMNSSMTGAEIVDATAIASPYSVNLTGLLRSTTYYYRAVVNSSFAQFFGETKQFVTPNPVGIPT